MNLKDRGDIERRTPSTNTINETVGAWSYVAQNVACAVLPVEGNAVQPETGREYVARRKVVFRFKTDIQFGDRFTNNGTKFAVVDVASYGTKVKIAIVERKP